MKLLPSVITAEDNLARKVIMHLMMSPRRLKRQRTPWKWRMKELLYSFLLILRADKHRNSHSIYDSIGAQVTKKLHMMVYMSSQLTELARCSAHIPMEPSTRRKSRSVKTIRQANSYLCGRKRLIARLLGLRPG